jgi:hypothetical protein
MIEPYQIGKNNQEGINSGAFWFYYKMGFRPQQKSLKLLAEYEYTKMKKNPSYRSTKEKLQELADSHLLFSFGNEKNQFIFDSPKISSEVLNYFLNDRIKNEVPKTDFHYLNEIQKQKGQPIEPELLLKLIKLKNKETELEYLHFVKNNFNTLKKYFS